MGLHAYPAVFDVALGKTGLSVVSANILGPEFRDMVLQGTLNQQALALAHLLSDVMNEQSIDYGSVVIRKDGETLAILPH